MNATSDYAAAKPLTGISPLGNPWVQTRSSASSAWPVSQICRYGWTLFVNPIDSKYHWGVKDIQWAFTLFVLIETWLVPVEGYLVDRFGPKWVVIGGGILVGIAWMINSAASSLAELYLGAVGRRRRHGRGVRHLRRQCAQVVSRPARHRRRSHRRRLRCRRGASPSSPSRT